MAFALVRTIGKFLLVTVVVIMGFNAMIGESDTRSLGVTTAINGGQSTDILFTDMIPSFFGEISSDDKAPKFDPNTGEKL